MEHHIWQLDLTEDDRRHIQEDPTHLPIPKVDRRPAMSFAIPIDWKIRCVLVRKSLVVPNCNHITYRHMQALGTSKYLMAIANHHGLQFWLFSPGGGFSGSHPTKTIPAANLGGDYTIAVDEQTRLVALTIASPVS